MSAQTVQTAGVAAMPRVNLMPPEIAEAARFRQLQMLMGGAVLVAAAIVGVLYMHAKSGVSSAQAEVDAAATQHAALQTKLAGLDQVQQTYADVQSKQQLLSQAMGQEIRWSYMLNDLALQIPSNVWLTGIQATETTAGGVASATPSTATTLPGATTAQTPIGSIAFSGVAFKNDDVADWLDVLSKEKGLSQPVFAGSTENAIGTKDVVVWSNSVVIDEKALSLRYDQTEKAGS